MANAFFDQYKDPRWQKIRLEALSASDFCCVRCGDSENELHVHHRRYIKGRNVWEYSVKELDVLCRSCHEETHHDKEVLLDMISRIEPNGISEVIEVLSAYCLEVIGPTQTNMNDGLSYTGFRLPGMAGSVAAAIVNNNDKKTAELVREAIHSGDCKALSKHLKSKKKA